MPRVRCSAAWKLAVLVASAPVPSSQGLHPKISLDALARSTGQATVREGELDAGPSFDRQSRLLILLHHLPEGFFLLLPLSGTWFQSVAALGLGCVFQHPA